MKKFYEGMFMLRVAFLIDTISCDTAGTQKQLLETLQRLNRRYVLPHLICLYRSQWMAENPLPCACTVLGYRGFIKSDFSGVVVQLAEMIRSHGFNVLHTFFEESIFVGYLGAMFSRQSPVLLSSRRDMGLGQENQPWYHTLFPLVLPFVNKRFDGIVANCHAVARYVSQREKTTIKKIQVILNGISFPDKPFGKPLFFKTLPNNLICIGIVASLTPVKRHDLLLRAVANIMEEVSCPPLMVICLGEGPEMYHLKALARKLKVESHLFFPGVVKDVSFWLYQLDIGVLCSDREGLSNAVMEYMACGLPVIVTKVGGNTELVDEENGICVPPGDVDALATAMIKLIRDSSLRSRMGKASLEKLKRCFSWQRSLMELELYYRRLLENRK